MSYSVVDTNVLCVASGKSVQANPSCVVKSIDCLSEIINNGTLLLDDHGLILKEYRNNLNLSGQPGSGDAFLKWAYIHQSDESKCITIHITPNNNQKNDFQEFPITNELLRFDPSDKKFVAVALASELHPTIFNAVDTDWAEYFGPLTSLGVVIEFLCPECMVF